MAHFPEDDFFTDGKELTAAERSLVGDFSYLYAMNADDLSNFEPAGVIGYIELKLVADPEAAEALPQFSQMLRTRMVAELFSNLRDLEVSRVVQERAVVRLTQ